MGSYLSIVTGYSTEEQHVRQTNTEAVLTPKFRTEYYQGSQSYISHYQTTRSAGCNGSSWSYNIPVYATRSVTKDRLVTDGTTESWVGVVNDTYRLNIGIISDQSDVKNQVTKSFPVGSFFRVRTVFWFWQTVYDAKGNSYPSTKLKIDPAYLRTVLILGSLSIVGGGFLWYWS